MNPEPYATMQEFLYEVGRLQDEGKLYNDVYFEFYDKESDKWNDLKPPLNWEYVIRSNLLVRPKPHNS